MASSRKSNSIDAVKHALDAAVSCIPLGDFPLAVAYSGGLDSSVLLHAVCKSSHGRERAVLAIHVDHGLSPNALLWKSHCEQVCSGLEVPLHVVKIDVPRGTRDGLESAARRLRYQALAGEAKGPILLAHHADDQAETFLHNTLRGAGVRGLAAMPSSSIATKLVRPFLGLTRQVLREYADRHALTWCEDESNQENRQTRNFLRNQVMPEIKARFPSATIQIARCAERMAGAQRLLDELAQVDAGGVPAEFPFPAGTLVTLAEHRARNLLLWLLHRAGVQNPGEARLRQFVHQLRTAPNDRNPEMRVGDMRLSRRKGHIVLE